MTAFHLFKPGRYDKELSEQACQTWRLLRDRGGYWSADEVKATFAGEGISQRPGRSLAALERRGHVRRFDPNERPPRYGVTTRCVPLPGESLEPSA